MSASAVAGRAIQTGSDGRIGCSILLIGAIVFGLWLGVTKTIEFAHGRLHNPDVAIEAEMRYWQKKDPCLPGEVLHFTWLGDKGAHRVECVPGNNMPRREPRG